MYNDEQMKCDIICVIGNTSVSDDTNGAAFLLLVSILYCTYKSGSRSILGQQILTPSSMLSLVNSTGDCTKIGLIWGSLELHVRRSQLGHEKDGLVRCSTDKKDKHLYTQNIFLKRIR